MKKVFPVVIIACSVFFFYSCNTHTNSDPKFVVVNFIDALGKKDIAMAKTLATSDAKTLLDKMGLMFESAKSANANEPNTFDKSNVEVGDAKISGDSATVPIKFKDLNKTINSGLRKEKEGWKVDLNLDFMMQMTADITKGIDSFSTDQMKNINIDSFDAAMKKGLPEADSLLKKMHVQ